MDAVEFEQSVENLGIIDPPLFERVASGRPRLVHHLADGLRSPHVDTECFAQGLGGAHCHGSLQVLEDLGASKARVRASRLELDSGWC